MDATLEENMKEHLKKASERETEIALIQLRLTRGDDNFQELSDVIKTMSDTITKISDNTNRTIVLLDGHKDAKGLVAIVNDYGKVIREHDKFFQRFFGAIGFVTFLGVTTIGIIIFYLWKYIKMKMWGTS